MAMEEREYRIDFFQLSVIANGEIGGPYDLLSAIANGDIASVGTSGGYTREIFDLSRRTRPSSFSGQFRKFRTSDLPEVGAAGVSAEELELAEGQGLIERNFFVFYRQHNLLGWHVNGHASTPKQLANFLAQATGQKVAADPVPVAGALDRLFAGNVDVKRITASIARPTNADLIEDGDFSDEAMAVLSGLDGDSMHISIGIDSRRGDSAGHLKHEAKRFLKSMLDRGATTAKADVFEDGVEHPIDLILDRVTSYQYEETDSKFPPSATMYRLIDNAHRDHRADFQAHFGEGDRILD